MASEAREVERLAILQVYRGIAATLVVLHHLTWWGGEPDFLSLPLLDQNAGLFLFGHSGVDFFFILSGFVMVWGYGSQAGNRRGLWPFLRGRFYRIYPTYWVVLAGTVAYYWWRPGIMDVAADWAALWRAVWLYGNGPWLVPPSGSLPFELALYAFFALSFVLGGRWFVGAALLWSARIVADWSGWAPTETAFPTLLSPQMLEFFLGAAAAVYVRRARPRLSGGWLAALAGGCLVLGVVDSVAVAHGIHKGVLIFAVPYTALIVGGVAYDWHAPRRYPRWLLLLGNASYSIYLTHYYLIWEINGRLYQYPSILRTIGHDGQLALVLVLVLASGVMAWGAIERPLLQAVRS